MHASFEARLLLAPALRGLHLALRVILVHAVLLFLRRLQLNLPDASLRAAGSCMRVWCNMAFVAVGARSRCIGSDGLWRPDGPADFVTGVTKAIYSHRTNS